ncbi:MAG: DUF5597 domain-containing protein [Burkholderiales bacterium]|nr:DUF5597 domain-containing protein [Phycisphaerae bacterium]
MSSRTFATAAIILVSISVSLSLAAEIPHLKKQGSATQLIVDDKPFLVLGGELGNTTSSNLQHMQPIWPLMTRMNLNTVLVAVAWDWVEPQEGTYDFTLVDGLLEGARQNNLRVVFLWFGSWKNGISSFVPAWVKADSNRFPRVKIASGKSVEILSPLSDANRDADTKAYTAFMKHLKEVDAERQTVIMVQMQNEVGVLGDSRDRGDAAVQAFASAVPGELIQYLTNNRQTLNADLRQAWDAAGAKTAGTWKEIFGETPQADEIFMAWHFARYMDHMTAAGKKEYALPVFTNSWIVQPEDTKPGDYPSGGPEPLTLDIWKAGAPAIDFNAPDIYLPEFAEWTQRFHRADNPLFVPESRGDARGAANAFYTIGRHDGIGYSPFGIEVVRRLVTGADDTTPMPADIENLPLPRAYDILRQLAPVILENQGKDKTTAALLDAAKQTESVTVGEYAINFEIRRNRRHPEQMAERGYAIAIAVGADEYLVAGQNISVTFTPQTPGPAIAGIAWVQAGEYKDGQWNVTRRLSGDDILINYKLAEAAAQNQSGSGLMFGPVGPTIQRVKLYRYE